MTAVKALAFALALGLLGAGCTEPGGPMPAGATGSYEDVARDFASALARRDYPAAYGMTSREYRTKTSLGEMRGEFEAIVPVDWTSVGPVEVGHAMASWPDKRPADVGWVYVSVGGETYSEGLTVIVAREAEALKVRSVEFGRP